MILEKIRMKNFDKKYKFVFFYSLITISSAVEGYDEIHRYRPILFFGEARLSRDGLMSSKIQANHGSASQAYNNCGVKVCAADIFGTSYNEAIALLGSRSVEALAGRCLQQLTFTELILTWYQNFARGFFVGCYVPFRTIHLYNFPQVSAYNPLQHRECMQRGMGDFACSLGWTYNYEETQKIDFVDIAVQAGVALPTSKPTLGYDLFDIALGYEGRTGYFFIVDGTCGALDWLTCGAHVQGLFFEQQPVQRTILTPKPDGSISNACACVPTHQNAAWVIGLFTKADHIILGFSCTLGYSFTYKGPQFVKTNGPIINGSRYYPWSMHTIHLELDYDLATYSNPYAPRVGVAYNKAVGGKNVYDTSLWGGLAEFTILFTF